jgi:hypothetical protein
MPVNSLVHQVEIEASETVETVDQLIDWLTIYSDGGDGSAEHLAESYVVELVVEKLSDSSEKRSVRVRLAEPI